MSELLTTFLVSLSAVFIVVDPPGVVPIFLSITANETQERARRTARRACWVGGSLLLFFAFFGGVLFKVLGVSLGAFRVAGGILLLVLALDMLRARTSQTKTTPEEEREAATKEDVAVVPLAVPLLSGPGAIATVMVLMSKGEGWVTGSMVGLSIVLTFVATYLLLSSAHWVQRVLKQSGVALLQRLAGLILAAIAVQFMVDGVRELFPGI